MKAKAKKPKKRLNINAATYPTVTVTTPAGWQHTIAAGLDPKARRRKPLGRAYRVEPWVCGHPRPDGVPGSDEVVAEAVRKAVGGWPCSVSC